MFLETGYERIGASRSSSGGIFPTMNSPRCNSEGEEDHQRAAVEFVMELAGRHTTVVSEKIVRCHSLVYADQIPVPMFNVDFDLRCLLWNKRAADLTGWPESEIFAMPRFHDVLFSSRSSHSKGLMKDVLKGVLDGHSTSQEVWNLRTKWGEQIKVLVVASPRMDARGVVSGAICVIMPYGATETKGSSYEENCNSVRMDEVTNLELEDDELSIEGGSPPDGDYRFLTELERPLSPYLDEIESSDNIFAAQRSLYSDEACMQAHEDGTSVCCQDWCRSNQGSPVEAGSVGNIPRPSSSTRARVMVVHSRQRGRKSLTLMLERCGFDVSCACDGTDALWRFERSMYGSQGFSIVFISLSLVRSDNYNLVREIRRMQLSDPESDYLTTPALIVAVANLDRWDVSIKEGLKQRDVEAGVDTVITFPSRIQQLRDTLTTLGVATDDYSSKPLHAAFNSWNNSMVLAR